MKMKMLMAVREDVSDFDSCLYDDDTDGDIWLAHDNCAVDVNEDVMIVLLFRLLLVLDSSADYIIGKSRT